jgi:short-subunit dehydrogenase
VQRTVLITGSTGGLGRALCTAFEHRGWAVIEHSRTASSNGRCNVVADLARPDAAQSIVAQLRELKMTPDAVVFNAGLGHFGAPGSLTPGALDDLLDVNVWAPMALTHALWPGLRERRGVVAMISSLAAAVPAPEYAAYAATKAALDGFARNLRIEAAGAVDVLSIWPGGIRTPMHARSGVPAERIAGWSLADPATAAEAIASRVVARRSGAIGAATTLARWAGRHTEDLIDVVVRRRAPPGALALPPARSTSERRRALITGAADGIGLALARLYAAAGFDVVGVDVDAERAAGALRELAGRLTLEIADLAQPEALGPLAMRLAARGPYDVIVQNAGISAVGAFVDSDLDRQRRVFDVNLRAPLQLTEALFAAGAVRAGARLAFMSSLSHYASYPGAAVYAATKDGLAHYARSLDAVLRPSGLSVLRVHPGPTRTAHAARYSPDNRREARRMAPAVLAGHIVRAIERRQRVLIPGLGNRLTALLGRWAPFVIEPIMKRALLDRMIPPR